MLRHSLRRFLPAVQEGRGVLVRYLSDGKVSGFDPQQICDVAAQADSIAFAQETANHWPFIAGVQHSLHWLHETTGCPWWITISLMTVGFRFLIFPVTLVQIKNSARLSNAMPEAEIAKMKFEQNVASGMDPKEARQWYVNQIGRIWEKYNCNPLRSVMPLFANGFLFVSFFIALRGLANVKVPSMCSEGLFWFTDLTVADPFYALPVINSAIFLLTVELGAADGMQGSTPEMVARMKLMMRILSVIFIPITANFPASLFCYWVTSSIFSLIQGQLIKNEGVRRILKLNVLTKKNTDPLKNPLFGKKVVLMDGKRAPEAAVAGAKTTDAQRLFNFSKKPQDGSPVPVYMTNPRKEAVQKARASTSRKELK